MSLSLARCNSQAHQQSPWACSRAFARRTAARVPQAPHPVDRCTDAYAKLGCRRPAGHPLHLNRRNHPFIKIRGIASSHPILASTSASILNQSCPDSGILNPIRPKPSCFKIQIARKPITLFFKVSKLGEISASVIVKRQNRDWRIRKPSSRNQAGNDVLCAGRE
jgi:hypothetical protein